MSQFGNLIRPPKRDPFEKFSLSCAGHPRLGSLKSPKATHCTPEFVIYIPECDTFKITTGRIGPRKKQQKIRLSFRWPGAGLGVDLSRFECQTIEKRHIHRVAFFTFSISNRVGQQTRFSSGRSWKRCFRPDSASSRTQTCCLYDLQSIIYQFRCIYGIRMAYLLVTSGKPTALRSLIFLLVKTAC
jgi:hypothetical protein